MALITGLRRWVSLAAALALAVTAAGLVVALTAAGSAGSAGREMSQRLLPAAAAAGVLLGDYNQQQTLLRNYVTNGTPASLRQFRQAGAAIPRQQAEVARLVRGYRQLPGQVTTAAAAHLAWLAWVAGPQLTAAGRGDFSSAQAIQAAILFTRPYVFAMRTPMTQLQAEITALSALPGESGMVATATIRDISQRLIAQAEGERLRAEAERARVERRLQQSERLESLGQLVGGVAHDFNNMLNVITGYADFVTEQVTSLAGEDPRMDAVLADVEQVRVAAERAVRLTRQLLIFARRDVMHPEVLDVNGVIGGIEQMLQRTLGDTSR